VEHAGRVAAPGSGTTVGDAHAATAPAAPAPRGFRHGFRALGVRDFRVFFIGALVSNCGSWVQLATIPWVLEQLTDNAIWSVGLAVAAQFLPASLLSPVAGRIADRFDRRKVLLLNQAALAVAAIALWAAWVAGVRSPTAIVALAGLTGLVSGLGIPTWQAFVPSLVDRSDLLSAITLNSMQFNGARAVGPALGGIVLATLGVAAAFLFNALTFVAVLVAIWIIPGRGRPEFEDLGESLWRELRSTLRYIRTKRGIQLSIALSVAVALLGNAVQTFTTKFADDVYGVGAGGYGLLAMALGVGAMIGGPILAGWGDVVSRGRLVAVSVVVYGVAVVLFGQSRYFVVGLLALVGCGFGFIAVIAATNTVTQLLVSDDRRGRVMAIRISAFTLAFPVGALVQSAVSEVIGPELTVTISGILLLALGVRLLWRPRTLEALDVAV
jgi:MFS family permease